MRPDTLMQGTIAFTIGLGIHMPDRESAEALAAALGAYGRSCTGG